MISNIWTSHWLAPPCSKVTTSPGKYPLPGLLTYNSVGKAIGPLSKDNISKVNPVPEPPVVGTFLPTL